jgi:NADH-quinone oxidoreductase subunit I
VLKCLEDRGSLPRGSSTRGGCRRSRSLIDPAGAAGVGVLMLRAFATGFATTFKHLFRKPITVRYPDQKMPMFPKYRGKQVLMRDENGLEKCVACGLCSVACPADAIYLEAAENDGSVQAGPRYAKVYQIHKTRCIFCGYCEEACPVSAIFMGKDYELAVYSKNDFIWDKDDLLVPATTSPVPAATTGTR